MMWLVLSLYLNFLSFQGEFGENSTVRPDLKQ